MPVYLQLFCRMRYVEIRHNLKSFGLGKLFSEDVIYYVYVGYEACEANECTEILWEIIRISVTLKP
jgi:hypothetical protein